MARSPDLKRRLLPVLIVTAGILGVIPTPTGTRTPLSSSKVIANIYRIYEVLNLYYARFGEYPAYIWGGSLEAWEQAVQDGRAPEIYDPLIKSGLMKKYPRNPFVTNSRSLCIRTNFDPRFGCLKPRNENGSPEAAKPNLDKVSFMGNILSDFRMKDKTVSPPGDQPRVYYLFAGDDDPDSYDWLPGQFGYRRISRARFVLFGYGFVKEHRTIDLLTEKEEQPWRMLEASDGRPLTPLGAVFRSLPGGKVEPGHPDGYPDGIIIVLTEKGRVDLPLIANPEKGGEKK